MQFIFLVAQRILGGTTITYYGKDWGMPIVAMLALPLLIYNVQSVALKDLPPELIVLFLDFLPDFEVLKCAWVSRGLRSISRAIYLRRHGIVAQQQYKTIISLVGNNPLPVAFILLSSGCSIIDSHQRIELLCDIFHLVQFYLPITEFCLNHRIVSFGLQYDKTEYDINLCNEMILLALLNVMGSLGPHCESISVSLSTRPTSGRPLPENRLVSVPDNILSKLRTTMTAVEAISLPLSIFNNLKLRPLYASLLRGDEVLSFTLNVGSDDSALYSVMEGLEFSQLTDLSIYSHGSSPIFLSDTFMKRHPNLQYVVLHRFVPTPVLPEFAETTFPMSICIRVRPHRVLLELPRNSKFAGVSSSYNGWKISGPMAHLAQLSVVPIWVYPDPTKSIFCATMAALTATVHGADSSLLRSDFSLSITLPPRLIKHAERSLGKVLGRQDHRCQCVTISSRSHICKGFRTLHLIVDRMESDSDVATLVVR